MLNSQLQTLWVESIILHSFESTNERWLITCNFFLLLLRVQACSRLCAFICWPWMQCANNSLARNTGFVRSRMSRHCLFNTVVIYEAHKCLSTSLCEAPVLPSADTVGPLCLVIQSAGKMIGGLSELPTRRVRENENIWHIRHLLQQTATT